MSWGDEFAGYNWRANRQSTSILILILILNLKVYALYEATHQPGPLGPVSLSAISGNVILSGVSHLGLEKSLSTAYQLRLYREGREVCMLVVLIPSSFLTVVSIAIAGFSVKCYSMVHLTSRCITQTGEAS